jgi:hypothetical protein
MALPTVLSTVAPKGLKPTTCQKTEGDNTGANRQQPELVGFGHFTAPRPDRRPQTVEQCGEASAIQNEDVLMANRS